MPDELDERERQGSSAATIVSTAAAASAVVLGVLYSVGAVLVAGALRETGVSVRDVLPLIPLPQMLGRGMSVLLGSAGTSLIALVIFGGAVWLSHDLERSRRLRLAEVKEMRNEVEKIPD